MYVGSKQKSSAAKQALQNKINMLTSNNNNNNTVSGASNCLKFFLCTFLLESEKWTWERRKVANTENDDKDTMDRKKTNAEVSKEV